MLVFHVGSELWLIHFGWPVSVVYTPYCHNDRVELCYCAVNFFCYFNSSSKISLSLSLGFQSSFFFFFAAVVYLCVFWTVCLFFVSWSVYLLTSFDIYCFLCDHAEESALI